MALHCRYLVNAAGLEAQTVARALQGFDPGSGARRAISPRGTTSSSVPAPPFAI